MPRTAALVATVALAVSGCGAPDEPAATTPTVHAQADAQREVLTKALSEFRRAPSGTYESEVTADGVSRPVAHETGSYRLRPAPAAAYERAILGLDPTSRKPRVQVVRVRGTADGQWFLQLKEWGSWTGCWLRTGASEISRLTGVTILKGRPLPTAVQILAKAKVVDAGDGMDGPHLAVDAYSAMQFLGVAASAIAGDREVLDKILVPVLLDVSADGSPSGAAVEGTQVVAALTAAAAPITSKLSTFVSKTHARVVVADLGKPVQVRSPETAELLPRDPSPTSTCAVNE